MLSGPKLHSSENPAQSCWALSSSQASGCQARDCKVATYLGIWTKVALLLLQVGAGQLQQIPAISCCSVVQRGGAPVVAGAGRHNGWQQVQAVAEHCNRCCLDTQVLRRGVSQVVCRTGT